MRLHLYEDGEQTGWIDLAESDAEYWGDDGAVQMLLAEVDGGIVETRPADVGGDWEGLRPTESVELRGEALRDRVEGVLVELGVRVVEVEVEEG